MPARFSVSSGTLISIHRSIYFLTAGHVLKALDELRNHDEVEIESAVLVDGRHFSPQWTTVHGALSELESIGDEISQEFRRSFATIR
jgi:hypothetical protein